MFARSNLKAPRGGGEESSFCLIQSSWTETELAIIQTWEVPFGTMMSADFPLASAGPVLMALVPTSCFHC